MSEYAYSSTRAKAMKTLLLNRATLESMAKAKSVDEILGILESTPYGEAISQLSLKYSGTELVDFALSESLAQNCRKVFEITPEIGKKQVSAFLEKFDALNLKTIILGKSLGKGAEEISRYIVPAGALKKEDLDKLLQKKDAQEIISALGGTEFSFLRKYESGSVEEILYALDSFYLKHLAEAGKEEESVSHLVKSEIDAKNLMIVLRGKKESLSDEKILSFCTSGGYLDSMLSVLVKSKDFKEIISKVSSRYDLNDAYGRYEKDGMLHHFEVSLERKIVQHDLRALSFSVLSLAVLVFFLYLKETEARNIRKIMVGKDYGLPYEKIMETVVFT